jgi:polar amino acid transport system substrate-binding protein
MGVRGMAVMIRSLVGGILLVLAIATGGARAQEEPLQVVTEDYPPFQYVEHATLVGPNKEVVEAVFERAGLPCRITVLPWERAIEMARSKPGVIIFTMARTPDREEQFKWIGNISAVDVDTNYLFYIRSDLKIASMEDAKKYVVGAALNEIARNYYLKRGFIEGKNVVFFREFASGYKMLMAGRIDFITINDVMAKYFERKFPGGKPLIQGIKLDSNVSVKGGFLAASRSTPDAVVEKLRAAYESVRDDGTYAAITKKYY